MDCFYLACSFSGLNFSPSQAEEESGLKLSKKNEPGEPGETGRYKDKPRPYGYGAIVAPENMLFDEKLFWLTNLINENIEIFRRCGAEDIVLDHAYYHFGQCNHEFSPEHLKQIADLGIPFTISCYRTGDDA